MPIVNGVNLGPMREWKAGDKARVNFIDGPVTLIQRIDWQTWTVESPLKNLYNIFEHDLEPVENSRHSSLDDTDIIPRGQRVLLHDGRTGYIAGHTWKADGNGRIVAKYLFQIERTKNDNFSERPVSIEKRKIREILYNEPEIWFDYSQDEE
jgi:hypothetical protein